LLDVFDHQAETSTPLQLLFLVTLFYSQSLKLRLPGTMVKSSNQWASPVCKLVGLVGDFFRV